MKKTVALLNKHCDMTGYSVLEKKRSLIVGFPNGTTKEMLCSEAIQDMTRLDEPSYFVRKKRMETIINEKAEVYLYVKKKCDLYGEFKYQTKDFQLISMQFPSFYVCLCQLCKQGRLVKTGRQSYVLPDRKDDPIFILSRRKAKG